MEIAPRAAIFPRFRISVPCLVALSALPKPPRKSASIPQISGSGDVPPFGNAPPAVVSTPRGGGVKVSSPRSTNIKAAS